MKDKVSIILIHYNTPQFLKTCFNSIHNQEHKNYELLFIDNNSKQNKDLQDILEAEEKNPKVKIIRNKENLGYSKAANQGIRLAIEHSTPSDFIMILNPDIILTPNFLKEGITYLINHKKAASICGKVYKYDFNKNKKNNIIDSTGLQIFRNYRIIDRGQGSEDKGQYNHTEKVFGISGSCPLYKTSALKDIKIFNEYLDENFFMYKEDIDLSWRFLLYGYENIYYPQMIAYHGRGTSAIERTTLKNIFKGRKHLNHFQKHHSYKNHCLMLAKNIFFSNYLRNIIPIIKWDVLRSLYILFLEPYLFWAYLKYLWLLPKALSKRRIIMKNTKIKPKDIYLYFTS